MRTEGGIATSGSSAPKPAAGWALRAASAAPGACRPSLGPTPQNLPQPRRAAVPLTGVGAGAGQRHGLAPLIGAGDRVGALVQAVGLGAEAHQVDAADGALRVQGGAAAGMWGACKRAAGSARAEGRLGQSREPHATCAGARRQGCSGPPLLQVPTRHRAAGCPARHGRGSRHAAPLQPGSAVHDLLPAPSTTTSACTSSHRQQPQRPSSRSSTAWAPQHRAQGEWKPHGGRHGDTGGKGLCPRWDPLSCIPGAWKPRGKFWGTEAAKEDEITWI